MIQHKNLQICTKFSRMRFANFVKMTICKFCNKKGPGKTSFMFCNQIIQNNNTFCNLSETPICKICEQMIRNNYLQQYWVRVYHQWPPLSKVFPFSYRIRAAPQPKYPPAPLLYCVHDSPITISNLPIALQAASLIFISLLGELHQITHRSESL